MSRESLIKGAIVYAKEYGHQRLEADAAVRKLDTDMADHHIGLAGDALDLLRQKLDELYEMGVSDARAPVEGSTPLDSPTSMRCAHCTAAIGVNEMFSVMDGCRHRLCSRCLDQDHECAAAPAGEVVSGDVVEAIMDTIDCYPGPVAGGPTRAHIEQLIRDYAAGQRAQGVEEGRRRADEPVPVPPPVDALRGVIEAARIYGRLAYADGRDDNDPEKSAAHWPTVKRAAEALWATGVEEGRRQRDAEIHASVFTSARLVAAEAGFGPVPESVAVSYDVTTGEKVTAATAHLLPAPRGYRCAAGCGHDIYSHREHGCDVGECECPAPHGRILPSAEATDHG